VRTPVKCAFRAYGSWLHCMKDHADFFLANSRYRKCFLEKTGEGWARAVAAAGYATDPGYADKLIAILRGRNLARFDVLADRVPAWAVVNSFCRAPWWWRGCWGPAGSACRATAMRGTKMAMTLPSTPAGSSTTTMLRSPVKPSRRCARSCTPGMPTPFKRKMNMQRISLLLSAACVLGLTACNALPQGQYQPSPRPVIDPLPPDLLLTEKGLTLCRRLLQRFSATERTLQASCGDTSGSWSGLKTAGQ
jgi:hypothetical protein